MCAVGLLIKQDDNAMIKKQENSIFAIDNVPSEDMGHSYQ